MHAACLLACVGFATLATAHIAMVWDEALLPCSCADGTLDCSRRGKSALGPEDACPDGNVTTLTLDDNLFSDLPSGFQSVEFVSAVRNRLRMPSESLLNPRMKELDLSHNAITNASTELRALGALESLHLGFNGLTHLLFLPAPCALRFLSVASNAVQSLAGPLGGCTQLRTLTLSDNKLTSLPEEVFSRMTELKTLLLNGNHLSQPLPPRAFSGLVHLEYLSLSDMGLTTLTADIFSSVPQLAGLSADNNSFVSLPADVFSPFANLSGLSLESELLSFPLEMLASVPGLRALHFSLNIATLPAGAFRQVPHLRQLQIHFVNPVAVSVDAFSGLSNLEVLQLSGNLPSVPSCLLASLTKLKTASFILPSWDQLLVGDMRNVTKLYFRQGASRAIGPRKFTPATQLEYLGLHNNEITSVADNAFEGLTSLQFLTLESNKITALPVGVFHGLESLIYLDLKNNSLTTLPPEIFAGLHELKAIVLSHNNLTTLSGRLFQGLVALEFVNLSHNRLTEVPADFFAHLASLAGLLLAYNRLTALPALPPSVVALEDASLEGNSITRPDETALRSWLRGRSKRYVDITKNGIDPSAVRWMLNDTQVRLAAHGPPGCGCGAARRGPVLLRFCVRTECAEDSWSWQDAARLPRDG